MWLELWIGVVIANCVLVAVAEPISGIFGGTPQLGQSDTESAVRNQLPNFAANSSYYGHPSIATNLNGRPVPSLTASLAIGTQGNVLLEDFHLIEKFASFNRERIPERVVHAKGAGAYGYFQVTHDISKYTRAKFLNGIGKKTPVFVRFSTVGGERGTSDTAVDPVGFATKFYTEDGNHDLVGNNIETFPIRDPMLFPDMTRSRKRNPVTNIVDRNMWWDFASLRPEVIHQALQLFSDIGRPLNYRRMGGAGAHAFKLVNDHGDIIFGKFHWQSNQPGPAATHLEMRELDGRNPDSKTLDLYDAIARKEYPSWKLNIQLMTLEQAKRHPRNPFDITRVWRVEDYPMIPVGTLTLNRNPSNYHAEVEQAAFSVSNMVPGIEASPDRILAARLFGYQDAIRYRLGVNNALIPVNRPLNEVNSYMRDGFMCTSDNGGGSPNYFPNSWGGATVDAVRAGQPPFAVEGIVDRYDEPEDEYVEARIFLERDVDPAQRRRMVEAIAYHMAPARSDIRERSFRVLFYPVEKKLGDEVREAVDRRVAALRAEQERDQSSTTTIAPRISQGFHVPVGWGVFK